MNLKKTSQLKSCPFCNGEARLSKNYMRIKGESIKCAWVYCLKCGAKTNYQLKDKSEFYVTDALNVWNVRANNE